MDEDFDKLFRKMVERMLKDLDMMFRAVGEVEPGKVYRKGFVYTFGPEGARFKELGGEEMTEKEEVIDAREPLVDIFEEKDGLRVLVELPGVKKEDIELDYLPPKMLVVKTKDGRFFKRIILPKAVDEKKIKVKYKNGVLEIEAPYGKEKGRKSRRIKVE